MVGQDLDINFFRSEKETGKITFGESRGNLRKTDSGEKPNKCNQCGNEFSSSFSLRRHLETHSGEKTNNCNQSGFTTIQEGNLRRHMETHSGGKTNKCNQCDYASIRADSLRDHLKRTVEKRVTNATNVIMHPLITAL